MMRGPHFSKGEAKIEKNTNWKKSCPKFGFFLQIYSTSPLTLKINMQQEIEVTAVICMLIACKIRFEFFLKFLFFH